MTFDDLFSRATGRSPYPYQREFAQGPVLPEVIEAMTGAGKTATVVLGWLYRRRFADVPVRRETPRRLVICLPMRTLVDQTVNAARTWLDALGLLAADEDGRPNSIRVHAVLGGALDDEWRHNPERDALIVGTQDTLLSRALNRGYGLSRFAWPTAFGLLSNDSLWVFDEVQLMGVGRATALQLDALRSTLGTYGPCASIFSSATLEPRHLKTVDHAPPTRILRLSAADLATPDLRKRRTAVKRIERAASRQGDARRLASEILDRHTGGTRTIVVLNTVRRALELHAALRKAPHPVVLLHSRFRPPEKARALALALDPAFQGVVVSTQVIEAGVDLTSRLLVTELAPWPCLVQRAGRCNRGGEYEEATVLWIDQGPSDADNALPYESASVDVARAALEDMDSFNAEAVERAGIPMPPDPPRHVLRKKDVIDLFDTTPDLAGMDVDVSLFIREGTERDAHVFWRDAPGPSPDAATPRPRRDELCPVPFLELRQWATERQALWRWDHLDGAWSPVRAREISPGGTYLANALAGGYDPERGWAPGSSAQVASLALATDEGEEADRDEPLSLAARWVTLDEHGNDAREEARSIVQDLSLAGLPGDQVVRAAHFHDWGKAHEVFQGTMARAGGAGGQIWAKSEGKEVRHARRGFRHELASALAILQTDDSPDRDLLAYLVAAHHGKVRLILRALPSDDAPPTPRSNAAHARGIWEGDTLPACRIGGLEVPSVRLSLDPMQIGGSSGVPSWAARMIALRQSLGPFRLAYLEALVRAADVRATRKERT